MLEDEWLKQITNTTLRDRVLLHSHFINICTHAKTAAPSASSSSKICRAGGGQPLEFKKLKI